MLKKLKTFFATAETGASTDQHDPLVLASCVLMIEAADATDGIADVEWQTITKLLQERFSLSAAQTQAVMDDAKNLQQDSVQLLRFTQTIKDEIAHEDRGKILELLWEIVLADDQISPLEDTLIRRIAGLLYVDDVERGAARRRVLARRKN